MTPPVRPDWYEAQHITLATALKEAIEAAMLMDSENVVVVRVDDNRIGFDVLLRSAYDQIASAGFSPHIAIVATVLPDAAIRLADPLYPARLPG